MYEVFEGELYVLGNTRLDWYRNSDLRSKSAIGTT